MCTFQSVYCCSSLLLACSLPPVHLISGLYKCIHAESFIRVGMENIKSIISVKDIFNYIVKWVVDLVFVDQ